jgi:hypothetical protein
MTTPGPLNTAFNAYLQLPTFSNLSDRQRRELRRSFFGGAQTLLAALQGSTPAMVQTLCVEIEMFFQDVEDGRA